MPMKFNQHAKKCLQEANNTHLKVIAIIPGHYLVQCVLGETIIQGNRASQMEESTQALVNKYTNESESDCRLLAFHPILDNFKSPFFNNPGLVHMTLKDLNYATA